MPRKTKIQIWTLKSASDYYIINIGQNKSIDIIDQKVYYSNYQLKQKSLELIANKISEN